MSVSLYCATAMTGRSGKELWDEVVRIRPIYEKYGIKFISPVEDEGITADLAVLMDRSDDEMTWIWKRKDKQQIRDVNVFLYIASKLNSQGVTKEYCLARGVLWKPCVGVYVGLKPGFISRAEDDVVASSHEEAALVIMARWGTRRKRVLWRLRMLNRSLLGWIVDQLCEFK